MLVEIHVMQDEHTPTRHKRWFQDNYFDLFVWQDDDAQIVSFQLCYDRFGKERVISWNHERGFGHHRIDDGEISPHKNMSPIFISDGKFSYEEVVPKFAQAVQHINADIGTFVMQKLAEYGQRT